MISIDRVQTVTFIFAMAGLIGIVLCVLFGFDEAALALGFTFGWAVGVFQTANHMIIEASQEALQRAEASGAAHSLNQIRSRHGATSRDTGAFE